MTINFRKTIIATLLVLAVVTGLFIWWFNRSPIITIDTDITPVKLEIAGKNFALDDKSSTIKLPEGRFEYAATATPQGISSSITLRGIVDTITQKKVSVVLGFQIYSKGIIQQTLCGDLALKDCEINGKELTIIFVDDNEWAVVGVKSDHNEHAVLRAVNGRWETVRGLGVEISERSSLPNSVYQVLKELGQ